MDGKGLRERICTGSHKDHNYNDLNIEIQQCSEEGKTKKVCGRTPDGTGESSTYGYTFGRIKLVMANGSQGEVPT